MLVIVVVIVAVHHAEAGGLGRRGRCAEGRCSGNRRAGGCAGSCTGSGGTLADAERAHGTSQVRVVAKGVVKGSSRFCGHVVEGRSASVGGDRAVVSVVGVLCEGLFVAERSVSRGGGNGGGCRVRGDNPVVIQLRVRELMIGGARGNNANTGKGNYQYNIEEDTHDS